MNLEAMLDDVQAARTKLAQEMADWEAFLDEYGDGSVEEALDTEIAAASCAQQAQPQVRRKVYPMKGTGLESIPALDTIFEGSGYGGVIEWLRSVREKNPTLAGFMSATDMVRTAIGDVASDLRNIILPGLKSGSTIRGGDLRTIVQAVRVATEKVLAQAPEFRGTPLHDAALAISEFDKPDGEWDVKRLTVWADVWSIYRKEIAKVYQQHVDELMAELKKGDKTRGAAKGRTVVAPRSR